MEMVAIVDRENNVVGAATRREMRERALPHRATYIVVENSQGEFYVQKRTMTKDVYPGYWDPVTGGVVQAGESYEESAVRELEEEMGITGVELRFLFDFWFEDGAKAPVWGRAFHCVWDGATRPQPEEVEYVERMTRTQIEARKDRLTPDGFEVMLRYWKRAAYARLVEARKACRACRRLSNPSQWPEFDSDQIGPWSLWRGNLEAQVMVVGQDWGDIKYFEENKGRDRDNNPTNRTLSELMTRAIGNSGFGEAFLTNAILCLKEGGMQGAVKTEWFNECGGRFLRPTIELVRPKVVVTLGERAYRAVCDAYGLTALAFGKAVESEPQPLHAGGPYLAPVYHCGARILNTHRPLEKQARDWERIQRVLAADTAILTLSRHER